MTSSDPTRFPLLPSQTGMRDGHLQDPDNAAYTVSQIVWFSGDELTEQMIVDATVRALHDTDALMMRADVDADGMWFQESRQGEDIPTHRVDLSDAEDPVQAARDLAFREVRRALQISGPEFPFRSFVLTLGDHSYGWFGVCHHMFVDGYGASLLRARVGQILGSLAAGDDVPDSPLGSFADLVARVPEQDPADLRFWKEHLEGAPDVISFSDRVAPPAPLYEMLDFRTPRFASRVAEVLEGVNWAHVAASAAIAYVSVVVEDPGVVVGLPITGRFTAEEKMTPSQSMGALPLHLRVDHGASLPDLVQTFRDTVRSTKRHQRQAPDTLRAELPTAWRTGRMYGPMVNVIPFEMPSMAGHLETGLEVISHGPCDDVSFTITPSDEDGVRTELLFNPSLYGPVQRRAHTDRFERWLQQVADHPDAALSDLICLTPDEERMHARLEVTPADGEAAPLVWGTPCSVADLAAAAGVHSATGLTLRSALGRPSLLGAPGRVVLRTADGPRETDLLAALTEVGMEYRGKAADRVVVNGIHVELAAVRDAVTKGGLHSGAEVSASARRITVRLGDGSGEAEREAVAQRLAGVTSAHVTVR